MSLKEYLENQKKDSAALKTEVSDKIERWKEQVGAVFDEIETWLQPLVDDKLMRIDRIKVDVHEQLSGRYSIAALVVRTADKEIWFKPKGRFIIGGLGRIDVSCGRRGYWLIRQEDGWMFVPEVLQYRNKTYDFTQENLEGVIEGLIK